MCPFDEGKQAVAIANKAAANAQAKSGKIDVEGREVAGEETPQVNGYSFVATPSPMPGAEESPFMTWGMYMDSVDAMNNHNSSNHSVLMGSF